MYAMHDQHLFLKMKISLANVLRGKKCIQQFFFCVWNTECKKNFVWLHRVPVGILHWKDYLWKLPIWLVQIKLLKINISLS